MKSLKQFINENSLNEAAGGADYESAIVMGYYSSQGLPIPDATELEISPKDYNKVMKDKSLLEAGERISKSIIQKVGTKKKAKQLGRGTYPLTQFWKNHGASNTTPKTDLMIGDSKISLKIGPAQLMSGGKAESLATFHAALKKATDLDNNTASVVAVLEKFEGFVERGLTKDGTVDAYIKGDKKGQDEIISIGDAVHKEMVTLLTDLFQKSESFKVAFAEEAMSGSMKFGDNSDAAAHYFLVGNKTGSNVSFHPITDGSYVSKVASVMKPTIRFKSSSQKSMGKKTGKYSYWSVVSLIVNNLDKTAKEVKEEFSANNTSKYLNEEALNEAIFSEIWKRIKAFVSKLIEQVKSWISSSVENLVGFLGVDPEIQTRGLDEAIQLPL